MKREGNSFSLKGCSLRYIRHIMNIFVWKHGKTKFRGLVLCFYPKLLPKITFFFFFLWYLHVFSKLCLLFVDKINGACISF